MAYAHLPMVCPTGPAFSPSLHLTVLRHTACFRFPRQFLPAPGSLGLLLPPLLSFLLALSLETLSAGLLQRP